MRKISNDDIHSGKTSKSERLIMYMLNDIADEMDKQSEAIERIEGSQIKRKLSIICDSCWKKLEQGAKDEM